MIQVNNTTTFIKSKTKIDHKFSISSLFISIMIIVLMLLILLDPVTYAKSIINGLTLYFTRVLPGLLPFMFLVKALTNQNIINKLTKPLRKKTIQLFGVSEFGAYAFLMSLISGYPIGSKITTDLYLNGQIKHNELTKSAILSSTPGLIFVIGSVGGLMLNNVKLGLYIYLINITSIVIAGLLINIFDKKKTAINVTYSQEKANQNSSKQTLSSLTQDTTVSLLSVGFYIALFTLIIDLMSNLKIFTFLPSVFNLSKENTTLFKSVMSGIIEMTNGAKSLSLSLTPLSFAFLSSIISFSGLSIIIQSLSFLSLTPLKPHKFLLGKLLQATICFIISFLFSPLILKL